MEKAKKEVLAWAVENGVSYKVSKAASTFWVAVCRARDCSFKVRIAKDRDGARITKMEDHNCPYHTHQNFRLAHSVGHLSSLHRAAVVDNRTITSRQIQSNERLQHVNMISYKQAWRTREKLRQDLDGDEEMAFKRLPALLDRMAAGDEHTVTRLEIDGSEKRFKRCFIAPGATRFGFLHCRKFLAVDATFIKSRYRMILTIAATIDANNQTLPLCWGLVPSENTEQWMWFMSCFVEAFGDFAIEENTVVMSDREKGIEEAIQQHLLLAMHGHCCQHIADNVQQRFGKQCRDLFWPLAYAQTENAYDAALVKLRDVKEDAADYVQQIPQNRWVTSAFPLPRYGHLTSNIIESVNAEWLGLRNLPVIPLLNQIWLIMMAKFHDRHHRRQGNMRFTDYVYSVLKQ